ncbi:hypothetical protein [Mediannikoviicoccus vaginalis]|uniref:hypothetical protein n=1 Tax=Mediannikoviicoccus vaginalis TaxID=2899727 RepID=UPI001F1AB184|nr:hypothetical protein [Mediannikoviicoccus vaginalis]
MKKTRGYISIYTLIIFMLLVSIITVLILGVKTESRKVINQGDYYQNKLIARSIYYIVINDENFIEFTKDPSKESLKKVQIGDLGLESYNGPVRLAFGENERGTVVSYEVKYKNTFTKNNIVVEKNNSKLLDDNSKVKLSDEEIQKIIENDLEKIGDDIVFYQKDETLYYLDRKDYEELLREIEKSFNEEDIEEDYEVEDEEAEDQEVIEIDIADYLDKFKTLDGDYFYSLKSFEVLSEDAPQLKGIAMLEEEGEKLGSITLNGILINHSPYKDVKVNGKVVEVSKYEGISTTSQEEILRLKDAFGLNLRPKVHRLMIK